MSHKFPIQNAPELFAECYTAGLAWGTANVRRRAPHQIVLAGSGVAGIAAECLQALTRERAAVPILVSRDYAVPAFVDPDTLVICLSETGNQEEIVYAISDSLDRNASVWVITGGGHLRDMALSQNLPCLLLPPDSSLPGLSLGSLFFALYGALLVGLPHVVLLSETASQDMDTTLGLLRSQRVAFDPNVSIERNAARQLAGAVRHSAPLIYGSCGIMAAAAHYWKAQFNTVGTKDATWHSFPEVEYEDFITFPAKGGIVLQAAVIALRDRQDSALIAERIDKMRVNTHESNVEFDWHEIYGDGPSALARLFTTLYFGDWTAIYLSENSD